MYFPLGPVQLHPHLVMEATAYGVGLYLGLFRRLHATPAGRPPLESSVRASITVGALCGALIGAKLLIVAQHWPLLWSDWRLFAQVVLQGKTIVGALLGGLLGVELTKQWLGVRRSTGDGFVWSVLWGTVLGRIGCFLTGLSDRTYGIATRLPWGVDFGDGIARHPTQLYEVVFLLGLFWLLRRCDRTPCSPETGQRRQEGDLFKIYMIAYLGFRLFVDFIKPEFRPLLGLSPVQMACVAGLAYYWLAYRQSWGRLFRLVWARPL